MAVARRPSSGLAVSPSQPSDALKYEPTNVVVKLGAVLVKSDVMVICPERMDMEECFCSQAVPMKQLNGREFPMNSVPCFVECIYRRCFVFGHLD